jgi:hypothetical protein
MSKVIAIPAAAEREAYVQVNTWTKPEGEGPWCPLKDKTSGAVFGWRHYYPLPAACEERTGICPPPEASVSMDGGHTWSPMKGTSESDWVSALKADTYTRWHIRRESGRLLARRVK